MVRDLNWDLVQLLQWRAGDDGSHATRRDRSYAPARMADALHEAGYRSLWAKGLRGKYVEALVRHGRTGRVSDATIMNRMAHVRWWAERIGKANLVKPNAEYGIRPRSHVSDGTRRRDLDAAKLARVRIPTSALRCACRLRSDPAGRRRSSSHPRATTGATAST